jgi:hypothetical protein
MHNWSDTRTISGAYTLSDPWSGSEETGETAGVVGAVNRGITDASPQGLEVPVSIGPLSESTGLESTESESTAESESAGESESTGASESFGRGARFIVPGSGATQEKSKPDRVYPARVRHGVS